MRPYLELGLMMALLIGFAWDDGLMGKGGWVRDRKYG